MSLPMHTVMHDAPFGCEDVFGPDVLDVDERTLSLAVLQVLER
jgi:hypothetical protein